MGLGQAGTSACQRRRRGGGGGRRGGRNFTTKPTHPKEDLIGKLYGLLLQLPVIGFNSGRYDLNVIKQCLVLHSLSMNQSKEEDEEEEDRKDERRDEGDAKA